MEFSIEKEIGNQFSYIRSLCHRYMRNPDEVDLLYSEVIEKIWRKRNKFQGDEKDFKGWAFVVTRNIFNTNYRIKKKQNTRSINDIHFSEHPHEPFNIEKDWDDKEQVKEILSLVKRELPPDMYEVFVMRFLDEEKYEDIAQKLNIPVGTVKNRIHRIRNFIDSQVDSQFSFSK